MTETNSQRRTPSSQLTILVLGLGVLVVAAIAILYRDSGFSIVAESGGQKVEFAFEEDRVDLTRLLDRLLATESGDGPPTAGDRRLVIAVLRAHNIYHVPSPAAADAIRNVDEEEEEDARAFAQAVREILYDLDGPFAVPGTLVSATDDRLLDAFEDLNRTAPANPIIARLWEMSLKWKGILSPRMIRVSIHEDTALDKGVAATCVGSIFLGNPSYVFVDDQVQPVEVTFGKSRPCAAASPVELLKGASAPVWLSRTDIGRMLPDQVPLGGRKLDAEIAVFPRNINLGPPVS